MTASGIVVQGVRRSFGAVAAVRDVTLTAAAGRVTGLVGPNGSGKTTLFLMLASLLRPDAGEIRIDGIDPVVSPQRVRATLGWMPDALGAWPSLTSRETLEVTARLHGLTRDAAAARATALLAEVGLDGLAEAPARVLSRGQKQRLGLARALVHDPAVLLLDEPASGLDPQGRVDLRVMLRRLAAQGRTVLVSSHVLAELEEVIDDAVFVVAGETVSDARVAEASKRARPWRVRLVAEAGADDPHARFAPGAPPDALTRVADALGVDPDTIGRDRHDLLIAFDSDAAAAASLRLLIDADLPVAEFAAATGTLEHTFLDLGSRPSPGTGPDTNGGNA